MNQTAIDLVYTSPTWVERSEILDAIDTRILTEIDGVGPKLELTIGERLKGQT